MDLASARDMAAGLQCEILFHMTASIGGLWVLQCGNLRETLLLIDMSHCQHDRAKPRAFNILTICAEFNTWQHSGFTFPCYLFGDTFIVTRTFLDAPHTLHNP